LGVEIDLVCILNKKKGESKDRLKDKYWYIISFLLCR